MPHIDDAVAALAEARRQASGERARRLLKRAIKISEESAGPDGVVIKAQALSDLALEEDDPSRRSRYWREALELLASSIHSPDDRLLIDAFASLSVDAFQDRFSDITDGERPRLLRAALAPLNAAIPVVSLAHSAQLLARKSAILRHLAYSAQVAPAESRNRLEESRNCARQAVERSDAMAAPAAHLELGLSEWALARRESAYEDYLVQLRRAEDELSRRDVLLLDAGRLTLARFYRMTFRALDACEGFPSRSSNYRLLLRNSYIYAEAACQLWWAKLPEPEVRKHLVSAKRLLELAIAGGYRNARIIIDLAIVEAIMNGVLAGSIRMQNIYSGDGGLDWAAAVRTIQVFDPADLFTEGFALGMGDGATWTRLGTFVHHFLENMGFAEYLYRKALSYTPADPIALTNLARLLMAKTPIQFIEPFVLLRLVEAVADQRFRWWRDLSAELDRRIEQFGLWTEIEEHLGLRPRTPRRRGRGAGKHLEDHLGPTIEIEGQLGKRLGAKVRRKRVTGKGAGRGKFEVFRAIHADFERVRNMTSPNARGFALEWIVYQLAELTFGFEHVLPSHRPKLEGFNERQVDCQFEHRYTTYKVECKWEKEPVSPDKIHAILSRLIAPTTAGLVISMSGFTLEACAAAREIVLVHRKVLLLMDGDELIRVLTGRDEFYEVMTYKRQYFQDTGEPYHMYEHGGTLI